MEKLFSTTAEFEVALRAGGRAFILRYPTDEEWADRHRAIKTVTARSGAGTQTKSTGVEEADLALFVAIAQTEKGAPPDEYEASALISKLMRAETSEAVAVPEGYQVRVAVVGGILTTHTLRVPTEKELRLYRKAAFVWVDMRHGRQELRTNPLAIGEFYDRLAVSSTGYAQGSGVPLNHKSAAVIEMTQAVDALDAEEDPELFI